MTKNSPKGLATKHLPDLAYPSRRFCKDATKLARKIPGIDSESMATAMATAGDEYAEIMEIHWEGSRRKILKAFVAVADASDAMCAALGKLGPKGRSLVLGPDVSLYSFLMKTEPGQWLMKLDQLKGQFQPEIEDTPWAGRPDGTTEAQHKARRALLLGCCRFLEPLSGEYPSAVFKLVPEMAKAVHRVICEPTLSNDSQLFRKEWKELKTVQK